MSCARQKKRKKKDRLGVRNHPSKGHLFILFFEVLQPESKGMRQACKHPHEDEITIGEDSHSEVCLSIRANQRQMIVSGFQMVM